MKVLVGLILLFISLAVTYGGLIERDEKIVGGKVVALEQTPYQVSLLYRSYHTCGGSIISSKFVLTACHCTKGTPVSYLSVRVGSQTLQQGGTVFQVATVSEHPSYNPYYFDFDYSILQLARDIPLNGVTTAPISLPEENDEIEDATQVLVSGWGATKSATESNKLLRAVVVSVMNQQKCDKIYAYDGGVTPRMICASSSRKGLVQCGPMKRLSDGALIGIVSFGMDCADATYPGVYSRVSYVRSWIKTVSGV